MKKILLVGLMAFISISLKAQSKKPIVFNKIDTSVTKIAELRNDTLIVHSNLNVFSEWFNKEEVKPQFKYIEFIKYFEGFFMGEKDSKIHIKMLLGNTLPKPYH